MNLGLLGQGWDDPKSAAIMALAGGLLQGNLGMGLLGGSQAFNEATRAKKQDALDDLKMRELQALIADREATTQQKQAAAERLKMIQQEAPNLMTQGGYSGGQAVPQEMGGIPMFSKPMGVAPMQQQAGGFDVRRALQLRMTPEEITAYAGLANIGRPEVARVEETTDAQGRPVKRQLDKFGNPVGGDLGQWKAPTMQNLGNRVAAIDPVSLQERGSFAQGIDPGTIYSGNITMRGQNMTDARARELNAINKEAGQTQIVQDPNQGPMLVNKATGLARPAVGLDGKPLMGEKEALSKKNASEVVGLIESAKKLIGDATGSYAGAGVDFAARVFGKGTEGANRIAQLKALEGALMMKMPRMEGPQSNIDVMNYRQAVGQIGDPTIPRETKLAAMQTVEEIQRRYAGIPNTTRQPGELGSGSWSIQRVN